MPAPPRARARGDGAPPRRRERRRRRGGRPRAARRPAPVEVAQNLGVEHVIGPPEREAATGEVQDAVDFAEDGVDVVRHEEHGGARRSSMVVDEADDGALIGEVETREGLVAEQEPGSSARA